MKTKIRRIDYFPDEFIAGVSGKLTPEQAGVYWMMCSLIYSKGEDIDNDAVWLGNIMRGTHWRTMKRLIAQLHAMGKIEIIGDKISVQRCRKELARTAQRIGKARASGEQGGRPIKEIKAVAKPNGSFKKKLTSNQQPAKENSIKESPKKSAIKKEGHIPEDWRPNPACVKFGRDRGYQDFKINQLAEDFHNYWLASASKTAVKKDWMAAFRTWIGKDLQRNGTPNQNSGQ